MMLLYKVRKRVFAKMLRYYILTSVGQYSFDFGIDETLLKIFCTLTKESSDLSAAYNLKPCLDSAKDCMCLDPICPQPNTNIFI